ncbi:Ppx/GppA phosphatase family protein [Carboxydothermus ferrireducens]|uniref:Exopolyphosphatase/guanosine-5'-triphosphate, 3'-diphosphate pyrophosphatase n=1 Tax=Carboxydothermus ferrireducens DSM 11255 TaxID=1119529 RepID=A0ABX2R874_9THEO|nr:hypothetical protein [Carboxydothermus ferrireducens]NYE57378.1 exopolyphosphatase/guanosine-5'-triphosphate,3'-diphosphate pyrophosphatase [Carboxydothermus ferrireducens DSM 11255]
MPAVIDIGTNSVRVLVGSFNNGKFYEEYRDLRTTRIGQGINSGYLKEEAMERTLRVVVEFVEKAREFTDEIVIFATSAVRDAKNQREFVDKIKSATGITLEVLTGEEEAYYSYQGVKLSLPYLNEPAVIDLGGGSIEFIWQERGKTLFQSVPVGAVRLMEAVDKEGLLKLLRDFVGKITPYFHEPVVAVGGTATTLAAIDLKLEKYDPRKVEGHTIELPRLREIHNYLESLPLPERQKVPGLLPERADIIVYGCKILIEVLTTARLSGLIVGEGDLLLGKLKEMTVSKENKGPKL